MPGDRKYISRYGTATFAILVRKDGVPAAADGQVAVSFIDQDLDPTTTLWTRNAVAAEVGQYEIVLGSADTEDPGWRSLRFSYQVDSIPQVFGYDIEVGESAPEYDSLPSDWQGAIETVWGRFADLFDSPFGGPNLQVYAQVNFGRNRLAQLMRPALQRLNSATGAHASYGYGSSFPFDEWGGLLQQSLYIEVLKHLVRSYVEQPEVILGTAVSRVDRRDYMNRWQDVLQMEQAEFERDLSRYKMAHLGLGNAHVLVAGGAYGNWGPQVNAGGSGSAASRGYFSVHRSH